MRAVTFHPENHLVSRIGWLRAGVLGANDGIVSTASLVIGVAASSATISQILVAGIAGLVAGAMSMAAGEYVSVSSQSDTEQADIAKERSELASQPAFELEELAQIYVKRGVELQLARQVAAQLTAKDALHAHSQDELGIHDLTTARPIQAALTSAGTFSIGAALPLMIAALVPSHWVIACVSSVSLCLLALLGAIGAKTGGASLWKATIRVTFWGAFAMGVTAAIGTFLGVTV